ncbi:MAG: hypothetical protein ING30_01865 [Burkholderiales bacterium]|nr:hypothetical protein [Burkholderiales bacterium]
MGSAVQAVSLTSSAEALAWLSRMKEREPQEMIIEALPALQELVSAPRPVYVQLGILETLRFPLLRAATGLVSTCAFRAVPMSENEAERSRPLIDLLHALRDGYSCLFSLAPVDLVRVADRYSSGDFRSDPMLRDRLAAFSSQVKPVSAKLLVAQRMISMQALYLEYCYRLRLVIPEADWELLMQYAKQIKQSDLLEEGVFDPMSPEYRVNGRMALVIALLLRLAHPESLLSSSFELARKICRRFVLKVKFRLEEGESASKPSSWPSVVTSVSAVRLDTRALIEELKNLGPELASGSFSPTLLIDTRFSAVPTSQTIQDLLNAWAVPARTATAWRAPLTENIRVVAGYHAMAGAMSKPAAILGNQETRSRSPYEYRQYSTEYAAEMNKEDPSLQRLRLLMEVAESWQTKGENATGLKCVRLARHPRLQLEQLCFISTDPDSDGRRLYLAYIDSLQQTIPLEASEQQVQQITLRLLNGIPRLLGIKPGSGSFEDAFLLGVIPNSDGQGGSGLYQLDFEQSSLILPLAHYPPGTITDMLFDGSLYRVQIGPQLFRGYDFDQVSFRLL